jgi:hypothetical protein
VTKRGGGDGLPAAESMAVKCVLHLRRLQLVALLSFSIATSSRTVGPKKGEQSREKGRGEGRTRGTHPTNIDTLLKKPTQTNIR